MRGRIRVGLCSWTDQELYETYYPKEVKRPKERLEYVSQEFPVLEVDASFYSLLPIETYRKWAQWSPDGFLLNVKAFGTLTLHAVDVKALPTGIRERLSPETAKQARAYPHHMSQEAQDMIWDAFVGSIWPVHEAGKLGATLFQFPPWFRPNPKNLEYIGHCKERLGDYQMAVEFRHASWLAGHQTQEVMEFLKQKDITYVCVDEPQGFESSVPPIAEVTSEKLAMVRFHGRNTETWEKKGLTTRERFNWWYAPEEMRDWVPHIVSMAEQAREVHCMMNPHAAQAIHGARVLRQELKEAGGYEA